MVKKKFKEIRNKAIRSVIRRYALALELPWLWQLGGVVCYTWPSYLKDWLLPILSTCPIPSSRLGMLRVPSVKEWQDQEECLLSRSSCPLEHSSFGAQDGPSLLVFCKALKIWLCAWDWGPESTSGLVICLQCCFLIMKRTFICLYV